MDSTAHRIVEQVYRAKKDSRAADELIASYMPFIRSETAKFLKRPPNAEDDALSIAMFAFYEAICKYSLMRGAFLHFAALQIRNRLIDDYRRESRNQGNISLDSPNDAEQTLGDMIPDPENQYEAGDLREATKQEITMLTEELEAFGITIQDVSADSPQRKRTVIVCRKAIDYAKSHPDIISEFRRTKRMPLAKIAEGAGVERKTLERHRRYLAAVLLICANRYEILWGHIAQVLERGGEA